MAEYSATKIEIEDNVGPVYYTRVSFTETMHGAVAGSGVGLDASIEAAVRDAGLNATSRSTLPWCVQSHDRYRRLDLYHPVCGKRTCERKPKHKKSEYLKAYHFCVLNAG